MSEPVRQYPESVDEVLRDALRRRQKVRPRRHAAEVTSDRLGEAVTKWCDEFTPDELDMIGIIRHRLEMIAQKGAA